jgi:hypothetical protein
MRARVEEKEEREHTVTEAEMDLLRHPPEQQPSLSAADSHSTSTSMLRFGSADVRCLAAPFSSASPANFASSLLLVHVPDILSLMGHDSVRTSRTLERFGEPRERVRVHSVDDTQAVRIVDDAFRGPFTWHLTRAGVRRFVALPRMRETAERQQITKWLSEKILSRMQSWAAHVAALTTQVPARLHTVRIHTASIATFQPANAAVYYLRPGPELQFRSVGIGTLLSANARFPVDAVVKVCLIGAEDLLQLRFGSFLPRGQMRQLFLNGIGAFSEPSERVRIFSGSYSRDSFCAYQDAANLLTSASFCWFLTRAGVRRFLDNLPSGGDPGAGALANWITLSVLPRMSEWIPIWSLTTKKQASSSPSSSVDVVQGHSAVSALTQAAVHTRAASKVITHPAAAPGALPVFRTSASAPSASATSVTTPMAAAPAALPLPMPPMRKKSHTPPSLFDMPPMKSEDTTATDGVMHEEEGDDSEEHLPMPPIAKEIIEIE